MYDPLSLGPEPMDIPIPKVHDLNVIIKALITKEFGECVPCFRDDTTITRVGLRIVAYALRILP